MAGLAWCLIYFSLTSLPSEQAWVLKTPTLVMGPNFPSSVRNEQVCTGAHKACSITDLQNGEERNEEMNE